MESAFLTRPPPAHPQRLMRQSGATVRRGNQGETIEWRAGDLLLSAPSWSEHAHFLHPEGSSTLTVQDHALHIGMESLI